VQGKGNKADLLHIVPVGNDTVFNGVLKSQDTTLGLGLITDIAVLVSHTQHDVGVTGTTNNGGEDGTGGVISGKTGLDHSGSVVNNKGLNLEKELVRESQQKRIKKKFIKKLKTLRS